MTSGSARAKANAQPFHRTINITPAYDQISEGYGRHNAEIHFIVADAERNTLVFDMYTGWNLPHLREKDLIDDYHPAMPYAANLQWHTHTPHYCDHAPDTEECQYIGPGKPCYASATSLCQDLAELLVRDGLEALWIEMEKRLAETVQSNKSIMELAR